MSAWQTTSSKIVYENPWMIVHEDQVVMPNGKDGMYGYVQARGDAVFIVPVDDNGNTYLVQQERYVTGQVVWEIPAGGTDGQPYEQAARRELLEEAGVEASTITILNEFYLANSILSLKGVVCLATNLKKVTDQLDSTDGIIAARKFPLATVRDMILSGEIVDGPTITAIFTVMAHLEQQSAKK
jgi:8-oxo-dGTP pyrophosphatase MutT (NUDIX family)